MYRLKNIFTILINTLVFVGCLSSAVVLTPKLDAKTNFTNEKLDSLSTIMRRAEIVDAGFFSKLDSLLRTTRIAKLPYRVVCFGSESSETSTSSTYIYIDKNKPLDENADIYIMVLGRYYPSDAVGDIIVRYKNKYYIFEDNPVPNGIITMRQDKCVFKYSINEIKKSMTIQPLTIKWDPSGKMEELSPMICPPW